MSVRCWWFGCERHEQDMTDPDYVHCMHCDQHISYSDLVGDTRHYRLVQWWRRLILRKPFLKCDDCGRRWRTCDDAIDHIPF